MAVLFERTKNSIKQASVTLLATEEATMVVKQADGMLRRVRAFDRAAIRLQSVPAPLCRFLL